jgi:hypothetical protein
MPPLGLPSPGCSDRNGPRTAVRLQQLGHETLSTTLRYYAHWIPKEVKENYGRLIDVRAGECPQVALEFPILTPDLPPRLTGSIR